MIRKPVLVSATAVANVIMQFSSSVVANAEGLTTNTHNSIQSIIESISPAPTSGRILHYFETPLTFSYLDSVESSEVIMKAMAKPIANTFMSPDCIQEVLVSLEPSVQADKSASTEEIEAIVAAYLASHSLTAADYNRYKDYKKEYEAEKDRLAALPPQEAQANAHFLAQIETDWGIFGRRSDFAELETQIAAITSGGLADIDPDELRRKIFEDEQNTIPVVSLSVPAQTWNMFDSWIFQRSSSPAVSAGASEVTAELEEIYRRDSACTEDACQLDWDPNSSSTYLMQLEVLAPAIELPWRSDILAALEDLPTTRETCRVARVPERVIVVRQLGISTSPNQLERISSILHDQKPFKIDEYLFAGIQDIGLNFGTTPSFRDNLVVSPFYYLVGFTSVPLK